MEDFKVAQVVAGPQAAGVAAQALTDICHGLAKAAGWWNQDDPRTSKANPLHFSNKLCLVHSEISEAMEGDRKGAMDDKLPHRPMREVELADAVIRIFDLAGGYGLDLAGAIVEKLAYNQKREDHKPEVRAAAGGKGY
jgi:NTP pyrophosphatase (non-canonical NTP hydrolase)